MGWGMLRKLFPVLALIIWSVPATVLGLGLGEIRGGSYLNEPLKAEIDLIGVKPTELDTLRVNLAPEREFEKAGAVRASALGQLRFQPRATASGRAVISVTSDQPIRDPFLDFLVEINWPQGRLVKEYTLLLDPPVTLPGVGPPPKLPVMVPPRPERVASAPSSAPPPSSAPRPVQRLPRPALAPGDTGVSYGPVRRGETLWSIAKRIKIPSASHREVLQALFRSNPDAFANRDINRLKAGAVLTLGKGGDPAVAASPAQGMSPLLPARGEGAAVTDAKPSGGAPVDQLRIASAEPKSGESGTQGPTAGMGGEGLGTLERDLNLVREDTETARKETTNVRQRVQDLEGQLTDIRKLLEIRNAQILQLQRELVGSEAATGMPPGERGGPAQPLTAAGRGADSAQESGRLLSASVPQSETGSADGDWSRGLGEWLSAVVSNPASLSVLAATALMLLLFFGYSRRRRGDVEPAVPAVAERVPLPGSVPSAATGQEVVSKVPRSGQPLGWPRALDQNPSASHLQNEPDVLEQADVFVGFNRYREAEQVLREALEREPQRLDLKVKLAEIYHGAGNSAAFSSLLWELERSTTLRLSNTTIDRLLVMAADLGLEPGAMPLVAEKPEPRSASFPPVDGSPVPAEPSGVVATRARGVATGMDEAAAPPGWLGSPPAEILYRGSDKTPEEPLDLDLDLDLDAALREIEQAKGGFAQEAEKAAARFVPDREALLRFDDLNLEALPEESGAPARSLASEAQAAAGDQQMGVQGVSQRGSALLAETSALKLELARAYLAMDDIAGARSILTEVIAEAEGESKEDAERLLASLG